MVYRYNNTTGKCPRARARAQSPSRNPGSRFAEAMAMCRPHQPSRSICKGYTAERAEQSQPMAYTHCINASDVNDDDKGGWDRYLTPAVQTVCGAEHGAPG